MKLLVLVIALIYIANGGIISEDHDVTHHERATSYQNIHREHFHPIPTFIKKEHKELLEHPVSLGTSSLKVEIHHGGKHDHGYGFATAQQDIQGHAFGGEGLEGLADHGGQQYEVQEGGLEGYEHQGLGQYGQQAAEYHHEA